jgi:uncharacterized protein YjiS (DUF1127 family)
MSAFDTRTPAHIGSAGRIGAMFTTAVSAFDTHTYARAHAHPASTGGLFTKIVNAIADWNEARATRDTLSRLTDRELNDIGLSRYDIDAVAKR